MKRKWTLPGWHSTQSGVWFQNSDPSTSIHRFGNHWRVMRRDANWWTETNLGAFPTLTEAIKSVRYQRSQ